MFSTGYALLSNPILRIVAMLLWATTKEARSCNGLCLETHSWKPVVVRGHTAAFRLVT